MVTATAIADKTLCCIDGDSLLKGLAKNTNFCLDVLKGFTADEEERHPKITYYENQRGIKKRPAGLLLYMKGKFGVAQEGNLKVSLKREDMSNVLGTSSEYIITLLTDFKRKGLVALGRGKITLLKEKELLKIL